MTKHATLFYSVTPPHGGDAISVCRGCMEGAVAKGWGLGKYSSEPVCVWCKKEADDKKAAEKRAKTEAKAGPKARARR